MAARWTGLLGVALAATLLGRPASAEAEREHGDWMARPAPPPTKVASGGTTAIRRSAPERWSLDAGMPRDGAYARAIGLEAEGRWGEALHEYAVALADLGGVAQLGLVAPACVPAWRAKVIWQREETERLLEQVAYVSILPGAPQAHYNLGTAYLRKFLAIRAFLGRGPRSLWTQARDEFLRALELEGRLAAARVGLATLYAEAGMHAEARAEVAAVSRRVGDTDLALPMASYLAASGDLDGAVRQLRRALVRPEVRRWVARTSDFDALRAHPGFQELLGTALESGLREPCAP